MTPEEIRRLAEAARRAGVQEFELDGPAVTLRLRLSGAETAPSQSHAASSASSDPRPGGVCSPGVGLFRHNHPVTGIAASVSGAQVVAGQIVGYLDLGSCLRPVTAPAVGTIGSPYHEDGTLVGYGALLYPLS